MSKPGRNDPCPCGSGKKYKKCHGDDSAPSPGREVKRLISMDQRLLTQLSEHGTKRFGAAGWDPFFLEPPHAHDHAHGEACEHDTHFADVSFPIALFSEPREGGSVAQDFLNTKGKYLGAEERAWLAAQERACFTVWQLEALPGDERVTLRDRLGEGVRTLVDPLLAAHGKQGELLLGRVVELDGVSVLTAVHPASALSDEAEEVLVEVRAALAGSATTPLHAHAQQVALVRAWTEALGDTADDAA